MSLQVVAVVRLDVSNPLRDIYVQNKHPKSKEKKMAKCYNLLVAEARNREEIRKLKRASRSSWEWFSLDQFFPTPLALVVKDRAHCNDYDIRERLIKETGFENSRDWRKHNWGVTSDVTDVCVCDDDKRRWVMSFTTTDCPPAPALRRLSDTFPTVQLSHKYIAMDASIAGNVVYRFAEPTKETRYEGVAYSNLIGRLKKAGNIIRDDFGKMSVVFTPWLRSDATYLPWFSDAMIWN